LGVKEYSAQDTVGKGLAGDKPIQGIYPMGMRCSNIQLRRERERYRGLKFWKREEEKLEIENGLNCE
jgi:hypothetical protein